jgi:tRNA pseudouridine32 synthase/23S rRNA pseudouridine746 synthase
VHKQSYFSEVQLLEFNSLNLKCAKCKTSPGQTHQKSCNFHCLLRTSSERLFVAMTPIYEDEHLLVLEKPSGLLSVPGRGPEKQDCLSKRVQAAYPEALIVHRLDQSTSGLLIMARGIEAQRRLSRLFETRQVKKRYIAVVANHPAETQSSQQPDEEGWRIIDGPIAFDWERRPLHIIHPDGKPSRSRWRVLQTGESATLIELEPVTGRTHQLRVHMQSIGHPMLGDALYAPPEIEALSPRLLLHAQELAFPHPFTGVELAFTLPVNWSASTPYLSN